MSNSKNKLSFGKTVQNSIGKTFSMLSQCKMRNTFDFHKNQFAGRTEHLQQYLERILAIIIKLKEKLLN